MFGVHQLNRFADLLACVVIATATSILCGVNAQAFTEWVAGSMMSAQISSRLSAERVFTRSRRHTRPV
jgi:hypothetical protein